MSKIKVNFKFGRLFVDSSWISNAKCRNCKKDIQIVRLPNKSKIAIEIDPINGEFTYHGKSCKKILNKEKYKKQERKEVYEKR